MIALVLTLLLAAAVSSDSPAIPAAPAAPAEPAPPAPGTPVPTDSPAPGAPTAGTPVPADPGAPLPALPAPGPGAPVPADSPAPGAPTAGKPVPGDPGAPLPALPAPAPGASVPADSPEPAVSEPAADSPVAIAAQVGPDPSQVGDLIKLEVTAAYPGGYTVNLPLGLTFDPLHVVSIDESEPESTGQGLRKVFTITLQHFAVGEASVPGFPITYLAPDGAVRTVQVPPTPFAVSSLLANEPDPKRQGEDPPVSLEYPNRTAELILYSGLAALLLGLVGGLLWARWRRRPRPVVLPPPVPAHVAAYQALDELEKADLITKNQFQDYYLELTEIAKAYIEGRFGVPALDRTTDELRRDLERHAAQISPLKPTDVVRFLQDCDLVKFARFAPPPSEAQGAFKSVREMVDATVPKLDAKDAKAPVPQDSPAAVKDARTPLASPVAQGGSAGLSVPQDGPLVVKDARAAAPASPAQPVPQDSPAAQAGPAVKEETK
jgi:hypothetical protein